MPRDFDDQIVSSNSNKEGATARRASLLAAFSVAALALFAPKADANQVTITVNGTILSGMDQNSAGPTGVFGPTGSLSGKPFKAVFTFDDTKGTQTLTPPTYSSITGSNSNSPGTATLTVEGTTVSLGTRFPTNVTSSTSRQLGAGTPLSVSIVASGSTGSEQMGINVYQGSGNPPITYDYDWRSPLSYTLLPTSTGGMSFGYYTATQAANGNIKVTDITISGPSPFGSLAGKTLGTQAVLCGCDGQPYDPSVGEPITVGTGNLVETVTDYESGGVNKLAFERTYNSMGPGAAPTSFATEFGPTGIWRHNYDRYLHVVSPNGTPTTVYAERADGQILTFTLSGSTWITDGDTDYRLTQSGTTWTLTDHNDMVETYNDLGTGEALLSTITQQNGYQQTLSYTGTQLQTVTDSYGRSLSLTYTTGGLLNTVTTPGGLVLTYGYTASGFHGTTQDRLSTVSYNTTPATSQTYLYGSSTFPLALTGITDENGHTVNGWSYDTLGRATQSERFKDAVPNAIDVTNVSYNDTTGARTVTNALGLQQTYTFTVDHGLPKVSQISRAAITGTLSIPAATRTFGYDTNGYQNSSTDWNSNTTAVTNNTHGQPTSVTEASGTSIARTVGISYDTVCIHKPAVITEPTRSTTNTFDAHCNIATSTVADLLPTAYPSRTSTFTWNGTGEILTAKGPRTDVNQTTTFTYDPAGTGNLITLANALGHTWSFTSYDADGHNKSFTDPNGLATNQTYDLRGQLLTHAEGSTTAGFETTTLTRDATETMTGVTNPDASVLTFGRDFAHRLTKITNSLGEHTDYTLDNAGNRTAVNVYDATSTLNRTHTFTFDALSRMRTDMGALGSSETSTYQYDNNGNPTSVTDPLSNVTSRTFDALNRLATLIEPANQGSGLATTISYSPDTQNLVGQVVSPRGVTTQYTRNGFGEVVTLSSPDSGYTDFGYDLAGNNITRTFGALTGTNTTTNTFDTLNRIKTATYQDATATSYFYDGTAAIGYMKSIADAGPGPNANNTFFGYDLHGRVTFKQNQFTGQTYTSVYNGTTGQLTSETYPSGMVIGYQYDAAGQQKEIDINAALYPTAAPFIAHITHQPFGPAKEWDWVSNYTHYARTFDLDGRLASYPLATATRTLTYDNASRVTNIDDSVNHQVIGYDASSEVNSYTGPFGNGNISSVTYDADRNRTGITTSAGTEVDTISSSSEQITQRVLGGVTTLYGYDGAGNTVSEGPATTYGYDVRNRASKTSTSAGTTTYTMNGLNEMMKRFGTGGSQRYFFAPAGKELTGRLVGIYQGNNATLDEVIMLDGNLPVGGAPAGGTTQTRDNALRIFAGHLNESLRATDNHMNLYETWDHDPFGVGAANYSPSGLGFFWDEMRFPGQLNLAETNYYHNGARIYMPQRGRYLQSDPIGLEGGINTYTYVNNNPTNNVDPRGLDSDSEPFDTPFINPECNSVTSSCVDTNTPLPPSPSGPFLICELTISKPCSYILRYGEAEPLVAVPLFALCEFGTSRFCELKFGGQDSFPELPQSIPAGQQCFPEPNH